MAGIKLPSEVQICGVCFDVLKNDYPQWHCGGCGCHWPMFVQECQSCHEPKKAKEPNTVTFVRSGKRNVNLPVVEMGDPRLPVFTLKA